jgi:DNA-binding XRE family transcriptional regulator
MNKTEVKIFNERLANRIKLSREIAGVRQEDMAKSLGMSRTNYVNLESGRVNIYSHYLWRIIQILGVKPNTLLQ